ncbi:MAG: multidrug effflux MFS transporter [Alphaproteobacteria bacterium]|nr:multidrug effflux MFS transporter [Alphaproteobacteria bacterium]
MLSHAAMQWLTTPLLRSRPRAPFWLLVAVTASGTLAMHILVPVLPLAAEDLAVSSGAIQLAITLYLFGVAGGQLLYGPVSDRFGRRPALLVALVLYVGASIVAGLAPNLTVLLIARVVQALGGCGGLVLGRAVVRDGAAEGQAASQMAMLTMVQSLAPGVGPAVGGYLGAWFGWRSIFAALFVFGVVTLIGTLFSLPETAGSRGSSSGRMLGSYLRLLRTPAFRGYMIGGALTTTSFYAYLSASPFIFTDILHRPAEEVGLYYLVVMVGVPIGSFAASRLVRRVRLGLLLQVTSAIAVVGAALFFAVAISGHLSVATILGAMIVYSVGVGAASPMALASALSTQPTMIGAASGLYGFVQMGFGALCTVAVSIWPNHPALTASTVLIASTVLGQLAFMAALKSRPASAG